MWSDFAVNKCLHTVASSWTFLLTLIHDARDHELKKQKLVPLLIEVPDHVYVLGLDIHVTRIKVNVSRRFQCSSIIRHTLPLSVPDAMTSRVLMFWLQGHTEQMPPKTYTCHKKVPNQITELVFHISYTSKARCVSHCSLHKPI
jgi:hypothetical protein